MPILELPVLWQILQIVGPAASSPLSFIGLFIYICTLSRAWAVQPQTASGSQRGVISGCNMMGRIACRMEIPSYLDQAAKSLSDPDQRQAGAEWDDWGHNEEDIDWEDPEFPEAHTESYYERRRRAW